MKNVAQMTSTKSLFFLAIAAVFITLLSVPLTLAHEEPDQATSTVIGEHEITIGELGLKNTGLLPTNPFYFAKEWWREVRLFFTPGPIKKTEYELRITNQKAAELKKIAETQAQDERALERAIDNYNKNVARLRARLESLKETSDNPQIDQLLNELTLRSIQHQQLFDELKEKFEAKRERIEAIQDELDNTLGPAFERLDKPEKIKIRIKTIVESQDPITPINELRTIKFISRLEGEIESEVIREELEEIKDEIIDRFEEELEAEGIDLEEIIEHLPGGEVIRIKIIEELGEGIRKTELKIRLEDLRAKFLEKTEKEEEEAAEEAEEIIEEAEELLNKLQEKVESGKFEVPESVRRLEGVTRDYLAKAKTLFEEKDFGAAFSQANSARVTAKSALKQLIEKEDEEEEDEED